jgi:hypothetical protein
MNQAKATAILRSACVLALVSLGLIVWSLFHPRPVPVIAAMSLGQVLGTLSFASFLYVVVDDLRQRASSPGSQAGDKHVK